MTVTPQNLAVHLSNTLSPNEQTRKTAERFLLEVETCPNFALHLLSIVDSEPVPSETRTAAAITFKNFVKRNWYSDEVNVNRITLEDRNAIKTHVVSLMLKSPEIIQRQLEDAISVIGKYDFPDAWPTLLPELIGNMTNSSDFHVINGVLKMAHSLFKKYRYEFKSQKLWTEIKLVLDMFAKPFTELFVKTVELAKVNADNPEALKVIFSSLVLGAKVFYSLNAQDLPEFFEDNINVWFPLFLELLSVTNDSLKTRGEEDAGLVEQLKSQICDNVSMYASKYGEEFEHLLPGFVEAVWKLLTSTGNEVKYDILVSNAMKFLKTVADRPANQPLFEQPGALDSLCTKVIIPNMEFRKSDEEMFEDNPEEFIRRDIEGSDVDTRRRAACDLVKSLSRYFEERITAVVGQYIQQMMALYASNPVQNWRSKDAAVYLVVSMTVKGSTARDGATQASELVNIPEFYASFIYTDLQNDRGINTLPVLRADALKFIVTFRNQLDVRSHILPALPVIIQHLNADSVVVHSYAANAVDKVFSLRRHSGQRGGDGPSVICGNDVRELLPPLLHGIFSVFSKEGSEENEYAMKALMRTLVTVKGDIIPVLEQLLPQLISKLEMVYKNPRKPTFNHYLFESICYCVKIGCESNKSFLGPFEQLLFPIFQKILTEDVTEFMPYVYQMLSSLLEIYDKGTVPETYDTLFASFLHPNVWNQPANYHGLVRFLTAYVERSSSTLVTAGKVEPLLGVFQKLIASKANDHEGFNIITSLVLHLDPSILNKYIQSIFRVLFNRLTQAKTTKFIKHLLVFFSLFAHKYGTGTLVQVVDSLQAGMFSMVLDRLYATELKNVDGAINIKICVVGLTAIILNYQPLINGQCRRLLPGLISALISVVELPVEPEYKEDDDLIDSVDVQEYQPSSVRLIAAAKNIFDPIPEVTDPKSHLKGVLKTLHQTNPMLMEQLYAEVKDQAKVSLPEYIK